MGLVTMLALSVSFTSCNYDEDALEPSNELTAYKLPQSDITHDYDQTIQKFYDDYDVYLLYNFSEKDAYWTPSGWMNGELSDDNDPDKGKSGFIVSKADEAYVGQQIDFLNEIWFSRINSEARKKLLPTLILLCSEVDDVRQSWVLTPVFKTIYAPVEIAAFNNYGNICVGYGNAKLATLTNAERKTYQQELFIQWVKYIAEHKAAPSDVFTSSVNYNDKTVTGALGPLKCTAVGILNDGYNTSALKDWQLFMLMMMLCPESWLTEDPDNLSGWYGWTQYVDGVTVYDYMGNFHGILNPAKDTKGILKNRYDLVRRYFVDNYHLDLQSIGNGNQ